MGSVSSPESESGGWCSESVVKGAVSEAVSGTVSDTVSDDIGPRVSISDSVSLSGFTCSISVGTSL